MVKTFKVNMSLINTLEGLIPLDFVIYLSRKRLFFPYYHIVSDGEKPYIKHLFPVKSVNQFNCELEYILKHFDPVTIEDIQNLSVNYKTLSPKKKQVLFTFDDGLREMYDIVYPILKAKGIPAIFFLNSGFVDNKDLFFRFKVSLIVDKICKNPNLISLCSDVLNFRSNPDFSGIQQCLKSVSYLNRNILDTVGHRIGLSFNEFLNKETPYLSSDQIKEMSSNGFLFGAHSIDHPYFHELTEEQQIHQIMESCKFVVDNFGSNHRFFSFPFYDYSVPGYIFEKLIKDTEINPALFFGSSGLKNDDLPYVFQRLTMDTDKGKSWIYSEYFKFLIKFLFFKTKYKHPV